MVQKMAVVVVQPADSPPVRYKGTIWIRVGPRRSIATIQDERLLNEKRRHRDIPFDIHPIPSSTIKDLNRLYFEEEYLPNAFAKEIILANDRSFEQRLCVCKMVTAHTYNPTVLGLLVCGIRPRDWLAGDYIQFLRINGTSITDKIVDEAEIDGHLAQIVNRIEEKMDSHNRVSIDIKTYSKERRENLYPRVAIQQIIRNALMHRIYEGTNAPIRVYWFNDRIEIYNPGGPYGAITEKNFGQPALTDYRNPNLAEAMKTLGYVQRFGIGISEARKALQENGNPPLEFNVTNTHIQAIIRGKT